MKIWKKVLGWMLCAMMVAGMLPVAARETSAAISSQTISVNRSKLQQDPISGAYKIGSYDELKEFAVKVNGGTTKANAILTADIDCGDAEDWVPIGINGKSYEGVFDGKGFTITGLSNKNVPESSTDDPSGENKKNAGLFGSVRGEKNDAGEFTGGIVKNVGLIGGYLEGIWTAGGIVGSNSGLISNCYSTATVVSGSNDATVGGIAGVSKGKIENCYNKGTVKVFISNKNVSAIYYVGGVVGTQKEGGQVIYCYNTGLVEGTSENVKLTETNYISVGGIAGNNSGGEIQYSYNAGVVNVNEEVESQKQIFVDVGGVAGKNGPDVFSYGYKCSILYCYNTGDVKGRAKALGATQKAYVYVGGVAGSNFDEIKNCFNTGKVEGETEASDKNVTSLLTDVGGVVGDSGTNFNCYNIGSVSGQAYYKNDNAPENSENCFVGGVIGSPNGVTTSNCYFDQSISFTVNGVPKDYTDKKANGNGSDSETFKGLSTAQMTGITDEQNPNGENAQTCMKGFSQEDGTSEAWLFRKNDEFGFFYPYLKGFNLDASGNQIDAESIRRVNWAARKENGDVVEISNYKELVAFAKAVNEDGKATVKGILAADIIVTDEENRNNPWIPIGNKDKPYQGIFDGNGHIISNLMIDLRDKDYVGLFGAVEVELDDEDNIIQGTGIIRNIGMENSKVSGNNNVGGVVGCCGGTVTNCYSTCVVSGFFYVGGVVGACPGNVTNCYSTGDVSGHTSVGGAVGACVGNVTNCYNTGDVSGPNSVGGVVGSGNSVTNCYNTGDVSGDIVVGGVVGDCGGIVTNCYSTGNVHGEGKDCDSVGGVVGRLVFGTVTNCYYDKSICPIGAVGCTSYEGSSDIGLTTVLMTGENALTNMVFSYEEGEVSPWLTAEDSVSDGKMYWHYPHLRGFAYDKNKTETNWPAKTEVSVTWDKEASYTYDGTPQGPTVKKVTVGEASIPEGSTSVAYFVYKNEEWIKTEGEPNNPGTYKMVIAFDDSEETVTKYFAILDADLYSVTYDDSSTEGSTNAGAHTAVVTFEEYKDETGEEKKRSVTESFTIKPAKLTIKAESESFVYDGKPHSNSGYTVTGLQGKEAVTVVVSGSITFPREKSVANVVKSYTFTTGSAENYDITTEDGTLTMMAASVPITITAASGKATYDGKAFSDTEVTVTKGNLLEGDELVAQATGSVTNVADSKEGNNKIAAGYKIMHGTEDVTENYVITVEDGTLTINPKPITDASITLEYEAEAEYTGSIIEPSVVVKDGENKLVEGTDYTVTYANNVDVTRDSEGKVILGAKIVISGMGNYSGELSASFMITPKKLTISADSDTKEYDGTALTKNSYGYTDLAKGDVIESVTITGSQTDAGNSKNAISNAKIVHGDDDVTGCYEITYVDGTLTVTNASAPELSDLVDGEKTAAVADLVENGEKQLLLTGPETLPEGYTAIEYSIDGGKTWTTEIPAVSEPGTYTIKTRYIADDNHTDFEGETYDVTIKALYTVIWKDDAGNVFDQKTYAEGETEPTTDKIPTKANDDEYKYLFDSWKKPGTVSGTTTTYEPVFIAIPLEMYYLVQDGDIEWEQGTDGTITFIVKRKQDDANCIKYFHGIRIGNVLLVQDYYDLVSGSTVITLKNDYLKTLAPGTYTVEIEFEDGLVSTQIKVLEKKQNTPTPEPSPTPVPVEPSAKTGDTSNLWLWAILAVIAAGTLGGVVAEKRVRKVRCR